VRGKRGGRERKQVVRRSKGRRPPTVTRPSLLENIPVMRHKGFIANVEKVSHRVNIRL
jgi:hypothetical protein